jgi:hypothetical protein
VFSLYNLTVKKIIIQLLCLLNVEEGRMNSKLTIGILTVATLFASGLGYKAHADVQSGASSNSVYRVYNTHSGEHFYTTSNFEKDSLVMAGWDYEGTGWQAPTSGQPVYRLYNPNAKGGDHYYTQSSYEAKSLVQKGWKEDNRGQPVFYSGGNINNYVSYNPNAQSGAHNYTTSQFEQQSLLNQGWKYGKVAWTVTGAGQNVTPMNLGQILKGDYSSVQGTWEDSNGRTLTFNGDKLIGNFNILLGDVKETTLSSNDVRNVLTDNVVMTILPQTQFDNTALLFASRNVSPSNVTDYTDKTRDRILFTVGGGTIEFESSKTAFYRIK